MTVDDILEDLTEVITHARRYRLDTWQLTLLQAARQRIQAVCAVEMGIDEHDLDSHAHVARLHMGAEDAGPNLCVCGSDRESWGAEPDGQIKLRRRATAIA
jgi:hypothetical protein